ncbi:MAG: phosphoglycerate dehydrogenase [Campylobacterota bacterium]
MAFKVVVCDHIHNDGLKLLENDKEIEYINAADEDKTKLLDTISDADITITRSSTDVDQKFIDAARNLKAIVRAGVGVDNVDIEGCSKKGIIVMNVPTANTIAAVELTMTHILSCVRTFPYAHNNLKQDRIWRRQDWYGTELKDKKLGVIGFGNIGSRVGIRAKAFEMDVIAYDPYIDPKKATDVGVKYTTDFNDILACDIITIHTPKTGETINMITKDEIAKMKEGVILVNCARGGLYNEKDLYEGLASKKIQFAGIDVFDKEPATDHPLLELDNVTVTPHLGANTLESQQRIGVQAAQQAIESAKGISYPNAMNLPIREDQITDIGKKYLDLAQKISFFAAQATKSSIKKIKISVEGEIEHYLDSLVTFSVVGALKESLGDKINYVNAEHVANDKGIEVVSQKAQKASGYLNMVCVELTAGNSVFSIAGTVFDEDKLRIIKINEYDLDIEPKGRLLLIKNDDTPGVIGDVGHILAKHNINIADFRLGRSDKQALALIVVDNDIDKSVLDELRALEATTEVSSVKI